MHTSSHSHLARSIDKYPRRECKPGTIAKLFKCYVRAIIQFLNEEGIEPREIHRRLCTVYGQGNVTAERNVHQCAEQFNKEDRRRMTKTKAANHLLP